MHCDQLVLKVLNWTVKMTKISSHGLHVTYITNMYMTLFYNCAAFLYLPTRIVTPATFMVAPSDAKLLVTIVAGNLLVFYMYDARKI